MQTLVKLAGADFEAGASFLDGSLFVMGMNVDRQDIYVMLC